MLIITILLCLWSSWAWAVNANPVPGSVWTWMGPTFGADWLLSPPSGCADITAWGAVGDGVTDNSDALSRAIAAQAGGDACVSFPPGKFKFSQPFAYTYPNVSMASIRLVGSGANVTQIFGPSSGVNWTFTFTQFFHSVHIAEMSFIATTPCSTCTAISIVQTAPPSATGEGYTGQSDFTRVNITGSDPSNDVTSSHNYWETGISINGVSNVNFTGVYIQGMQTSSGPTPGTSRGIYIFGTSTEVPVVFNFTNISINLYNRAIEIGAYVQGVTITGSNFTGNFYGLYLSTAFGQGGAQLDVSNSAMNNCQDILAGGYLFIGISNSYFQAGVQAYPCGFSTAGIELGGNSYYANISHNTFAGNGVAPQTAIHTNSDSGVGGVFVGNMINNFSVGIYLTGQASGIVIANNVIASSSNAGILLVGNPSTCGPSFNQPCGSAINGGISIIANDLNANNEAIGLGDAFVQGITIADNMLFNNTVDIGNGTGGTPNRIDIPQPCAFAPALSFGGSTTGIGYASHSCVYTTKGVDTIVQFDYLLNAVGSATGQAALGGFPTATTTLAGAVGSVTVSVSSGMSGLTGAITGVVTAGQNTAALDMSGPTGTTGLTNANFTNSSHITGTIVYKTP